MLLTNKFDSPEDLNTPEKNSYKDLPIEKIDSENSTTLTSEEAIKNIGTSGNGLTGTVNTNMFSSDPELKSELFPSKENLKETNPNIPVLSEEKPEIIENITPNTIAVVQNDSMQKIIFSAKGIVWTIEKGARIPVERIPVWVKQHPDFQSYRRDKMLNYSSITAQPRNL